MTQSTNGAARPIDRQVVLALQGGGALGAYQLGVYEAMHAAGVDPDWVIGTSIGAINAGLIAGNPPERRVERLQAFWDGIETADAFGLARFWPASVAAAAFNLGTITNGVAGFFKPNMSAWLGPHAALGVEKAAYYSTAPLRATLESLIDFDYLNAQRTRLTVGAVNARTGEMRYFDSRKERIGPEHIMASGALPPAFPAVRIDGEPYWDGGIYSNTPTEVVLEDHPRRDSVIFSVHLWDASGPEPESLWQVAGRQKDIQYASRANSHNERQKQIHHLRHIIRELAMRLPADLANDPDIHELAAWGCGTTMHLIRLIAPRLEAEDQTKDIDFSPRGVRMRLAKGREDAARALAAAPWRQPVDPREGVVIHDVE